MMPDGSQQSTQPVLQLDPAVIKVDERLSEELALLMASRADNTVRLRNDLASLTKRAQHLDVLLGAARKELSDGASSVATLESAVRELETAQHDCCKDGVVGADGIDGVDSVIQAGNPLHAQVFDLLAEDAAIEDTLYFLGRALQTKGVGVADCLKAMRGMARKQFIVRALLDKAKTIGGL